MIFKIFLVAVGAVFILGCGVKGDPLPPDHPVDLGRGKNSYKKAVQDVQLPNMKSPRPAPEKKKDENEPE